MLHSRNLAASDTHSLLATPASLSQLATLVSLSQLATPASLNLLAILASNSQLATPVSLSLLVILVSLSQLATLASLSMLTLQASLSPMLTLHLLATHLTQNQPLLTLDPQPSMQPSQEFLQLRLTHHTPPSLNNRPWLMNTLHLLHRCLAPQGSQLHLPHTSPKNDWWDEGPKYWTQLVGCVCVCVLRCLCSLHDASVKQFNSAGVLCVDAAVLLEVINTGTGIVLMLCWCYA